MQFKHIFIEHFGLDTKEKIKMILKNRDELLDWKKQKILFLSKFYNLYNRIPENLDFNSPDILSLKNDFFELLIIFLLWRIEVDEKCYDFFNIPRNFTSDFSKIFPLLEDDLNNKYYSGFANKLIHLLEFIAIKEVNNEPLK